MDKTGEINFTMEIASDTGLEFLNICIFWQSGDLKTLNFPINVNYADISGSH